MNKEIILASASPRRQELMQDLPFSFRVETANCEKVFDEILGVGKAIEQIALTKAQAVARLHPDALIIGADTMVCLDDQMLGKPKDAQDAKRMLMLLSGKTHKVITGVAIVDEGEAETYHVETLVHFYTLEEALIDWYIESKEPFDKAGAYGIQGKGKLFVKEIHGDYFNVMGLPTASLYRHLLKHSKKI